MEKYTIFAKWMTKTQINEELHKQIVAIILHTMNEKIYPMDLAYTALKKHTRNYKLPQSNKFKNINYCRYRIRSWL